MLRQPESRLSRLVESGQVAFETTAGSEEMDVAAVETDVKYEGYLAREHAAVARARREEARRIPDDFAYEGLPGLTREAIERLSEVRPETLGQAGRVPASRRRPSRSSASTSRSGAAERAWPNQ